MKYLVLSKDESQFNEFKKWQVMPSDFVYVRDEITLMSVRNPDIILLEGWPANPDYKKIHNLKQIITRVRRKS